MGRSRRKGLSSIISTAIIIGIVLVIGMIAGSYVYSIIKSRLTSNRMVSFQGGNGFPDPSNSSVLVFSVYLKLLGHANVTITKVNVVYSGNTYDAKCINCRSVNTIPPGPGDLVEYKFYAVLPGSVKPNSKYAVVVYYLVDGRQESTNVIIITN